MKDSNHHGAAKCSVTGSILSKDAPAFSKSPFRLSREGAFQQQQTNPSSRFVYARSMVIPLPPEASMTFAQDLSMSSGDSFGIVTRYFIDTSISFAAGVMMSAA
ncbi:MAG: hypothetical protein KAR44_06420 [Candidatus Aegiribacteria sp.]|nr:hypothetical protein [Candidatus Aegiribacteria sp.]